MDDPFGEPSDEPIPDHPLGWWLADVIFQQMLEEYDVCRNCGHTHDLCGCCQGCGDPDADVNPRGHGYGSCV